MSGGRRANVEAGRGVTAKFPTRRRPILVLQDQEGKGYGLRALPRKYHGVVSSKLSREQTRSGRRAPDYTSCLADA